MSWVFVVIVTDRSDRSFDVRCVVDTLEAGQEYVRAELVRAGVRGFTGWTYEFGGATARSGGLEYEIRPAKKV